MKNISETMCVMPWTSVATSNGGGFNACCRMKTTKESSSFNSIKEYINSDYLKNIKNTFVNNKYPDECIRCKNDDNNGIISKRVKENFEWLNKNGQDIPIQECGFSFFHLMISNECNLGCITCSPYNSSFLCNEIDKSKTLHFLTQCKIGKRPYNDDQIDEIIKLITPNSTLYITGGEPSINSQVKYILEKLIEKKINKTIFLTFSSNFHKISETWLNLLEKFNGRMLVSIDGIGNANEYIRYPSNWKNTSNNFQKFIERCGKTWSINIMPAVSLLNIFEIKKIYDFVFNLIKKEHTELKIIVSLNNILVNPNVFDVRNLSDKAKQIAINDMLEIVNVYEKYLDNLKIKSLNNIIKQIELPKQTSFNKTINVLKKIDNLRNLNWTESLNELYKNTKE